MLYGTHLGVVCTLLVTLVRTTRKPHSNRATIGYRRSCFVWSAPPSVLKCMPIIFLKMQFLLLRRKIGDQLFEWVTLNRFLTWTAASPCLSRTALAVIIHTYRFHFAWNLPSGIEWSQCTRMGRTTRNRRRQSDSRFKAGCVPRSRCRSQIKRIVHRTRVMGSICSWFAVARKGRRVFQFTLPQNNLCVWHYFCRDR